MAAIAAMVPVGSRVADIGTDHAYLPIQLVASGIVSYAVAGEVNLGPYRSAVDSVRRYNFSEKISVRLGNGLAVLSPGEVDTVVIAGMGGMTIIEILSERPDIAKGLSRLILQPMLAAGTVRRWLAANGWRLAEETLAKEDGRIYEVVAVEPGQMDVVEPILFDVGPLLWQQRHPLLKEHLAAQIAQLQKIVDRMSGSLSAASLPRNREFQEKIVLMEEKYLCL